MGNITLGLKVIESLTAGGEQGVGHQLLTYLLDADGNVRFTSIVLFHDEVCHLFGFSLRRNTSQFVRPGGRHLFYVRGNLLLRVKTSGTWIHPTPHMTISAAVGLDWEDEAAKFNRQGQVVPKLGVSRAGSDWRALQRIGDYDAIVAADQAWADSCHFDFVSGFTDAGAAALPVES